MAAIFNFNEFDVEKTGTKANVPSSATARLMYYLNCICNLLAIDEDNSLAKIRNYAKPYLSEAETKQLITMCILLQPKVLINKCIFLAPELCGDCSNEFYSINKINHVLAVSNSLVIGGQNKKVQKIMAFKESWLKDNYLEPIV
jgi:hypothetical protein